MKLQENILVQIVEDSPTQREQLQFLLEYRGRYRVQAAGDGEGALQQIKENLPDVIISDIVMPGMNGYDLCRKIKSDESTKFIPVILLTTLSEPDDVIMGLECGADNFLTKPYSSESLLERVHYILVNSNARKYRKSEMGLEIIRGKSTYFITSSRIQILDLLISSYDNAVQRSKELEKALKELNDAKETISNMAGIIPICARCKKNSG